MKEGKQYRTHPLILSRCRRASVCVRASRRKGEIGLRETKITLTRSAIICEVHLREGGKRSTLETVHA